MAALIAPLPGAVSAIFAEASVSGTLTLADRYGLMAILLSGSMTEEERAAVDRLLYAVQRHRITSSSEISAIA